MENVKITRRQWLAGSSVLLLGLAAAACGGTAAQGGSVSSSTTGSPAATGAGSGAARSTASGVASGSAASAAKAVIALDAEPSTLDPHQVRDTTSRRLTRPLFDSPVIYKPGTFTIQPGLATSWEQSSDGLTWTFHLRKGATFHDGSPVNAQAVKASFDRQLHPDSALGTFPFGPSNWPEVSNVTAPDDQTVVFQLKTPKSDMLDQAATFSAEIVSPAATAKYGKDFPTNPVGSGPYQLGSWQKGNQIIFEANPQWWGGKQPVQRLVFTWIPEAQPRLVALQTGNADWAYGIPVDLMQTVKDDKRFRVDSFNTPNVWYVQLNMKKPPFDNVKIRQALSYAVDRKAIVDGVLKGAGTLAKGPLAPTFGSYVNADLPDYAYDPAKAKALLAEGGMPNGFKTTMLVPQAGAGMQQPVQMATVIQANLKAIGVDVQIQTTDFASASTAWVGGNFEISPRAYNPATGDPFGVLKAFHTGPVGTTNYNGYNNPEVDKLLDQARATLDAQARTNLYKQAQAIIVGDAPWIFVDHEILYNISAAGLTGLQTDLNGDLRVEGIGYAK